MKTISTAVSNIAMKTFVGTALTATIIMSTAKLLDSFVRLIAPYQQSALWELTFFIPVALLSYGGIYLIFRKSAPKRLQKKEASVSNEIDLQQAITHFAVGFLQGYEDQEVEKQTRQENKNETTTSEPHHIVH